MGSCSTKSKTSSTVVLQKQPTKIKETDETQDASCNSFPDPLRHTIFTRYLNAVPQQIREYDPNYNGTQYNVMVNGILFSAISPPDHITHPLQFLDERILEENE